MRPYLIELGGVRVPAYGSLMVVALLAGLLLARYRARQAGIEPRRAMYVLIWMMLGMWLGSKLLYYVLNVPPDLPTLEAHFNFLRISGKRLFGGIPLAALFAWSRCRVQQVPFWKTMDVVTPSFLLGLFLQRIGCFCNGCCAGRSTGMPWGVDFVAGTAERYQQFLGDATIPLHPTQLYAAACACLFFFLALAIDRRKPFAGFTLLSMLNLYGVARFVIEFYRVSHDRRGMSLLPGLTHNQVWSILLVVVSLVVTLALWQHSRRPEAIPAAAEPPAD